MCFLKLASVYEKTLRKLRIKGNSPNLIKSVYPKSVAKIILRHFEHKPSKIESERKNSLFAYDTVIYVKPKTHQQTIRIEKIQQDSLRLICKN